MTYPSFSHLRTALLAAVLLALAPAFAGCDGGDDEPDLTGGVDLARLFAAPTDAEIEAVRAEWASRTPEARGVEVLLEGDLLGDGSTVAILSHTMSGVDVSEFTHYGAVRIPAGEAPDGGWPVLVLNHGGDDGFDLQTYLSYIADPAQSPFGAVAAQSVVVIPTFRSETMTNTPLGELASGGTPSPWDRDVDDAIALTEAVLQTYSDATDGERIGTLGISRGGNVSLLLAARDARIDAVVDYFGPTDFFTPSIQFLGTTLLAGTPDNQATVRQVPGAIYLEENLLLPLADGAVSYEQARLELVKRSSTYFTSLLPALVAHHHECDAVVPFDQFESLQAAAGASADAQFYGYTAGCPDGESGAAFHSFDPAVMPENLERTAAFFGQTVLSVGSAVAF